MKRLFAVALGILTAIGGFVDIGDIVANARGRAPGSASRTPGCWWSAWSASARTRRCAAG